jgi:glycosyltransferase involved in cell wall biosynthesis
MPPTISVILPTYDRLQFLPAAVNSVLSQTFRDWELIIADDGSGPETRSYLASLAHEPRVKVLLLSRRGNPGAMRNAALLEARADYVAFIDSDDQWMPQKLEVQVAALRAHVDCQWSYTEFIRIDAGGKSMDAQRNPNRVLHDGRIVEQLLRLTVGIAMPTVMARRQLVADAGGFDESLEMHEDYELWLRLALMSEVAAVKMPLGYVRRHGEHFSSGGIRTLLARKAVLEKMTRIISDRHYLSIVQQQRALNIAALAAAYAANRDVRSLCMTLHGNWRLFWRYAAWYRGAAMAIVRILTPHWALAVLRRHRKTTPAAR